jgi:hypothetical protein
VKLEFYREEVKVDFYRNGEKILVMFDKEELRELRENEDFDDLRDSREEIEIFTPKISLVIRVWRDDWRKGYVGWDPTYIDGFYTHVGEVVIVDGLVFVDGEEPVDLPYRRTSPWLCMEITEIDTEIDREETTEEDYEEAREEL